MNHVEFRICYYVSILGLSLALHNCHEWFRQDDQYGINQEKEAYHNWSRGGAQLMTDTLHTSHEKKDYNLMLITIHSRCVIFYI